MRFFRSITNALKKSEATIVVQNLLELQVRNGLYDFDPATSAKHLVDAVWKKTPHMFDGRFGQRPHKLSIAGAAFSNAVDALHSRNPNTAPFLICLGKILHEFSVNGNLYPFNNLDFDMLKLSLLIYEKASKVLSESSFGKEIDQLLGHHYDDWDTWFSDYKDEAGKYNLVLAADIKGFSLIDLMDHEPLRRAFGAKIEPRGLGMEFAKEFDIFKMGV